MIVVRTRAARPIVQWTSEGVWRFGGRRHGGRAVEEIATEIDQSVANTSQHLQQLLRAGLVRTRRDGTRIYYALADDRVAELWAMMRAVAAEHVGQIEQLATAYLGDRDHLRTVIRAELKRRLRSRTSS